MTKIDRVVVEGIAPKILGPRPEDISWTLAPHHTPSFDTIVAALLSETTVNERLTIGALLDLVERRDLDAIQAVMKRETPVSGGNTSEELTLYRGSELALSLSLSLCELSRHYRDVFLPQLTSFGERSVRERPDRSTLPQRPIYTNPPSPRFDRRPLSGEDED